MITLLFLLLLFVLLLRALFSILRIHFHFFLPISYAVIGLLLVCVLIYRSVQLHFPALTGMFEASVFFSACLLLLFSLLGFKKEKLSAVFLSGGGFLAVILLALASSPLMASEILAPVPALRSWWLLMHVSFAFIGDAFFTGGFICSILFLLTSAQEKKIFLDNLSVQLISFGYLFFTSGALIFGAVWAQKAWGSYWSWDPKEVWALITWLVYSLFLHLRLIRKMQGTAVHFVSLIGWFLALFTFLGVNYLMKGLHSY